MNLKNKMKRQLKEEDWDRNWLNEWSTQEKIWSTSYSFKRLREELQKIILEKNLKVCEFGCGGGLWLKWIRDTFKSKVAGIDNSKEGLNLTKRRLKNARLRLADVRKVPFKENSFNFVYGLGLLEHFEDKDIQKITNEAFRVLKLNGKFFISIPNRSKYSGLWFYEQIFGEEPGERVINKKELMNFFKNAGFKCVKISFGGLFIPIIRNKKWFSKLNLKLLETSKSSDFIFICGVK